MNTSTIEDVEDFRHRARAWIRAELRALGPDETSGFTRNTGSDEAELAETNRARTLQATFAEGGFAGICVPREYGGQGLTPDHQRALNEELIGYEHPDIIQTPTFSPVLGVLLEFATEDQKRTHVPRILRGEEIWMQFLSEPSGGSDVAAALTTAVRDGDEWVMNGSKVWTSGAWRADWALCLARTNWDVPKHRGLTVFMLPIHQPGIDVRRIEMLNGSREFCEEFITDVRIPDSDRVGDVDGGWTVGQRWMFHERMHRNSPNVTAAPTTVAEIAGSALAIARAVEKADDPYVRDLVGESRVLELVRPALQRRISEAIRSGVLPDQAAAINRLFVGTTGARRTTIAYEIAGVAGGVWTDEDGAAAGVGVQYLMRQAGCIGGGTIEMARNVISERVYGMPREATHDRELAFRDVPRSRSTNSD